MTITFKPHIQSFSSLKPLFQVLKLLAPIIIISIKSKPKKFQITFLFSLKFGILQIKCVTHLSNQNPEKKERNEKNTQK